MDGEAGIAGDAKVTQDGASRTPKAPRVPSVPRVPRILALSSRVARGRVGLSIVEPAMQALGCDVLALPTIQLAGRPGLGRLAGAATPPETLRDMVDALAESGALRGLDAVLTGYAPSAAHVAVLVHAVEAVRAASPRARVVCDPVLGDEGRVYLDQAAAEAMSRDLAPRADLITPNAFEMGWLAGNEGIAGDLKALRAAALAHPAPTVVVTSAPALLRDHLGTLLVTEGGSVMAEARAAPQAPNGTGDLFGALLTAHLAHGRALEEALKRAVGGVHGVTLRSHRAGAEHLLVTEEAHELVSPTQPVSLRRIGGERRAAVRASEL